MAERPDLDSIEARLASALGEWMPGLNVGDARRITAYARQLEQENATLRGIVKRWRNGWAADLERATWLKITGWETEHVQPMDPAEQALLASIDQENP